MRTQCLEVVDRFGRQDDLKFHYGQNIARRVCLSIILCRLTLRPSCRGRLPSRDLKNRLTAKTPSGPPRGPDWETGRSGEWGTKEATTLGRPCLPPPPIIFLVASLGPCVVQERRLWLQNLEALCGSCDLAPDGSVRHHVLADDPGAVAECHPAAGFPHCRPLCLGDVA
ncbi:MAG: hypothetical protein MZV64_73705 [Ignavibacteriales bacterium]|nr:hypothetical protein [Ignavibacteriales bacterium]